MTNGETSDLMPFYLEDKIYLKKIKLKDMKN